MNTLALCAVAICGEIDAPPIRIVMIADIARMEVALVIAKVCTKYVIASSLSWHVTRCHMILLHFLKNSNLKF